jgi:hypothetical protein
MRGFGVRARLNGLARVLDRLGFEPSRSSNSRLQPDFSGNTRIPDAAYGVAPSYLRLFTWIEGSRRDARHFANYAIVNI